MSYIEEINDEPGEYQFGKSGEFWHASFMAHLTQKKLRPEVERWKGLGLIGSGQAEQLLALYPERGRNHWSTAFLVIGSLLVLGGVILVISSNWQHIPDLVKFAVLLVLLAGSVSLGTESIRRGMRRAWSECAFLGAAVFPLLGMMLISQTFHVQGKATGLLLLWTASIAALPFLSRTVSSWVVLLIAIQSVIFAFVSDYSQLLGSALEVAMAASTGYGILLVAGSRIWRRLAGGMQAGIAEFWGLATAFLSFYLLSAIHEEGVWQGGWLLTFIAALALVLVGYRREQVHHVNLGFAFVALVMISFFLRLVGTMLHTGVLFIVGGIGILVTVLLLNHLRGKLLKALPRKN